MPLILARIALLPAADGGRDGPLFGGIRYSPLHNFSGPENFNMAGGDINLPPDTVLHPGGSVDLQIDLGAFASSGSI